MGKRRMKSGPFDGKVMRFCTSLVLPVDESRTGECSQCGACCEFLVKCPLLKRDESGTPKCGAYVLRPIQCRKYPRSADEQVHQPCGYRFDGGPE
jgi:Fe-S-cluster containining protein